MIEGGIRMPRQPPAQITPDGEPHVVAGAQHRREGEQAHQRHDRADDAGRGGEQRAGGERGDGERAGQPPDASWSDRNSRSRMFARSMM